MTYEYGQYLAHHGIKGQKWGVRRYQNEDGSLTEEGLKRYQKEVYKGLKDVAKETSRYHGKDYASTVSKLASGMPEEIVSKHRDAYKAFSREYKRLSDRERKYSATGQGKKLTDKDYENFEKNHMKPLDDALRSDARKVLGKYSQKKLTSVKGPYGYKVKSKAEDILVSAMNTKLLMMDYQDKQKKNKVKETIHYVRL